MNKMTFVLITTSSIIFSAVLTGCSDRETANKSANPETTQQASEAATPAHIETDDHGVPDGVDSQMDHDGSGHGHETGGHGDINSHEKQESMAHEHGEQMDMHGGSHWNAPAEAANLVNPVAVDAVSIQRGRNSFLNNCASCHGNSGRGDGPIALALEPRPADLVVMAPTHPAGDFYWKIENGRGSMPAWKDTLSENQIWDLVNYIKSLGEAEPSATNDNGGDGHNHAH